MDKIQMLFGIIQERYKNPWSISVNGTISTQDFNWGIEMIIVAAPETDAIISYLGQGQTLNQAVDDLVIAVINDKPQKGNLG